MQKQKIKKPAIEIGEKRQKDYLPCNIDPFSNFNPSWLIMDDDIDIAIKKAVKSHKKRKNHIKKIRLHEVPDISVYTKYSEHCLKSKPNKL